MENEGQLLDGLAWASIPEHVRIARIANALVEEQPTYEGERITKTKVKDKVKSTFPPHGKGKAYFEAVYGKGDSDGEFVRQLRIRRQREALANEMAQEQRESRRLDVRINRAYAAAFSRKMLEPSRRFPGAYYDHEEKAKWEAEEALRDKGDDCAALTHQGEHVVALVKMENGHYTPHIATRLKSGPITRTYLRTSCDTFINAIVELGGPKVTSALSKGKRVQTDWVGRRTLIHHDGSDHEAPKVEIVPWRTAQYELVQETDWQNRPSVKVKAVQTMTLGDRVTKLDMVGEAHTFGISWVDGTDDD